MREKTVSPTASPALDGKSSAPAKDNEKDKKKDHPRDSARELAETVVFVVVLVLMLKTFVAEAFVIPTGSMAETLRGIHRTVTCDQCGYRFPVNCANEIDPQPGHARVAITGGTCPNCEFLMTWTENTAPSWSSGDRVLVAKFLYDNDRLWKPKRHQVIVFKYPGEQKGDGIDGGPQRGSSAMNYIKRCMGISGETIAILGGDLYVTSSLTFPPPPGDSNDYWFQTFMHSNDESAISLLEQSLTRRVANEAKPTDFEIIRKPLDTLLDIRRIVFDNDHQPVDLAGTIQRWQTPGDKRRWKGDDVRMPKVFSYEGAESDSNESWLEYNHFPRNTIPLLKAPGFENDQRCLITNMMGYNSGREEGNKDGTEWVGDLMLDCTVKVNTGVGELVFELAKGIDRFQARFNLTNGDCSLVRLSGKLGEKQETTQLAKESTKLKQSGAFHVRFANFDERLTVWVDRQRPFGDGVAYRPAAQSGPVGANDLLPARIGTAKGSVEVSHLQLWRDSYYTVYRPGQVQVPGGRATCQTMYIQPGHYLALGDNSSSSADSRMWGLVPERLLLGRALMIYFPIWPWTHRIGFIH